MSCMIPQRQQVAGTQQSAGWNPSRRFQSCRRFRPCSLDLSRAPFPGPVSCSCSAAAGLAGPESRTGWGQCLSACVLAVFLAGFNTLEQKQRHTFLLPAFALEFLTDRGKFLSGAGLLFRDGLLIPQAGLQFHVGSA